MKLDMMERGLDALAEGAWVGELPFPFLEGVSLRVRQLWNPDYAVLFGELSADLPKDEAGKLSAADHEQVTDQCLRDTVLVDWRGIDDECNAEAKALVFSGERMRETWRAAIIWSASQVFDTVSASLKADAKN